MTNLEKYRKEFEKSLSNIDGPDCISIIGISDMHCNAVDCEKCAKGFVDWLLEDDSQNIKNTQNSHNIELQSRQRLLVRNENDENWVEGYFICYFDGLYWCKYNKEDSIAYGWKQAAIVLSGKCNV